jgi:hypothetical protein
VGEGVKACPRAGCERFACPVRFLFGGIILSNLARLYRVTVEDIEGTHADIHVAFDSLFGPGKLVALEPQGLVLTPAQSESED